jgi:hypothetical protein
MNEEKSTPYQGEESIPMGLPADHNEAVGMPMSPLAEAIQEEKYGDSPVHKRLKDARFRVDSLRKTAKLFRANLYDATPGMLTDASEVGRQTSIAITALQQARQFMGKMLQEKGAAYPYSKDQRESHLEDEGEVLEAYQNLPLGDLRGKIKLLRDKIGDEITETLIFIEQVAVVGALDFVCQNTVVQKLLEARFAFGEMYPFVGE